jgi:pantoate--beta-alanine ligase
VVAKLFHAALPDIAVFGEKDYQQLLVIRRMVTDLAFPVAVIGLPTVREADGLALSSRNAYLTPDERAVAPELHAAMERAAEAIRARTPIGEALVEATTDLNGVGFVVDYLQVRNAETLAKVRDQAAEPLRMLAAVWLGKTRLIDNIAV